MSGFDTLRHSLNRLHNQIVIPLITATAIVGAIATAMGIVLISGIVDQWVEESAQTSILGLRAHFTETQRRLAGDARFLSEDPRLLDALAVGSTDEVTRELVTLRPSLGVDHILVMDEDGKVVATVGTLAIPAGETPLVEDARRWAKLELNYTTFWQQDEHQAMVSLHQVSGRLGKPYRLAVFEVVDADFLTSARPGAGQNFCFTNAGATCLATTVDAERGSDLDPHVWLDLEVVSEALATKEPRTVKIEPGGIPHTVRVEPLVLEGDPTASESFLISIIEASVAAETQTTTVRLIAFWSAVALAALWVLGMVVAQRVSQPIVRLTESARDVAAGEYTHRVAPAGSNEIGELSVAFNEMTDSLRERNESLTKKVLELATLYEMSRLLGGTLELRPLLDSVLDSALRIFDVESGYIILRDKETGELRIAAWRGAMSEDPSTTELRSSISEWVVREGRPLIFNPTQGEHEQLRVDSIIGATTALCVPLMSSEGPIGAVTVGSTDGTVRFAGDDVRLLSTVANHATIAIGNIELFSSLQDAYLATVRSLAAAVDAKDTYTRGHSDRVAVYAMAIAEKLDLSADQAHTLEMAAYLHDIGKIGIQESILLKPGRLTDEEMGQMRHHPLIGASILRPVVFPWPVAPIIRHHHEHFDGAGYPAGLKGEEIPLLARILTVADAFEAMTADRPYRMGRSFKEAETELQRCSGTHFDPMVVEALVESLAELEEPIDLVTVTSGDVQRDEARAVFVAVADGMFASFRRLGGPRLAANVEQRLNAAFEEAGLACSYSGGRLFFRWDDAQGTEQELEALRSIIVLVAETMRSYAGQTLVDHFYTEALGALSGRLRLAATALDFRPVA